MNVGDTLRTVAVFAAAFISSVTGIDGDICDAWAAIVSGNFHDPVHLYARTYISNAIQCFNSGLTIIVLVVYLVIEIIHHSRRQGLTHAYSCVYIHL